MNRIATVALVVPEYAPAISFYVEAVGFLLLSDIDLGGGKRWVTVAPPGPGAALLLAKAVGPAQGAAIGQQTGGRVGFFLETDDFERDHAAMVAKGVVFEAKFFAKVRDNLTKPCVEVFEVPQHM